MRGHKSSNQVAPKLNWLYPASSLLQCHCPEISQGESGCIGDISHSVAALFYLLLAFILLSTLLLLLCIRLNTRSIEKLSLCGQILIFLQHTLHRRHLLPKSFTCENASDTDNLLLCATRVKKGNSELCPNNIICEYITWLMKMACKHLIKSSWSCSALRADESSATVT